VSAISNKVWLSPMSAISNKVWLSLVSAISHLTQFCVLITCIFSREGPEKMSFCMGSNSSV
jgi:hypothetical protein